MNKELESEAQSYLDRNYNLSYERTTWQKLHEKTFIAGATSKYVEKQKLEFAIGQLKYVKTQCYNLRQFKADLLLDAKIKELEQQLSELYE